MPTATCLKPSRFARLALGGLAAVLGVGGALWKAGSTAPSAPGSVSSRPVARFVRGRPVPAPARALAPSVVGKVNPLPQDDTVAFSDAHAGAGDANSMELGTNGSPAIPTTGRGIRPSAGASQGGAVPAPGAAQPPPGADGADGEPLPDSSRLSAEPQPAVPLSKDPARFDVLSAAPAAAVRSLLATDVDGAAAAVELSPALRAEARRLLEELLPRYLPEELPWSAVSGRMLDLQAEVDARLASNLSAEQRVALADYRHDREERAAKAATQTLLGAAAASLELSSEDVQRVREGLDRRRLPWRSSAGGGVDAEEVVRRIAAAAREELSPDVASRLDRWLASRPEAGPNVAGAGPEAGR
ncbi:MAG: hypothetical protein HYZ53_27890 [Planctomycetes bacterium]|nr:hypothetical protein [Planctomycetota bacterium]